MNAPWLEQLVEAVLYEGHILYPYRASARKNRQRFTFGRIYPRDYSRAQKGAEPCVQQTECLVQAGSEGPVIEVCVRFLRPLARDIGKLSSPATDWDPNEPAPFIIVPELRVGEELFQTWQDAEERKIELAREALRPLTQQMAISVPGSRELEPIHDGHRRVVGVIRRTRAALQGSISLNVSAIDGEVFKVTVRIENTTPVPAADLDDPESVLMRTMASVHTILHVEGGEFFSMTERPADYAGAVGQCKNIGAWPVLVGDGQTLQRDTMLSSPIILYDYPKIAPESAGPLFDGTEIDEILSLRILTLTDQEKIEMRHVDEQARRLLERTEALPENAWLKMHGAIREGSPGASTAPTQAAPAPPGPEAAAPIEFDDFFGANTRLHEVSLGGVYLRAGDRVRLRPKGRADVLDIALAGQTAVVEAVEQDAERRVHLAVVLEQDPGKDLGLMRQPGHRFFYGVDEVEPLREEAR